MAATTQTVTGRLLIGDQWNAINIIAQSQTHPLKAVCELVENAIDARSRNIEIRRLRRQGRIFLEIEDDGNGLILDDDDLPDFDRIATHICDSMKRHLGESDREGIHGEFGIGLLSFWSLGEQLRITSAALDNRLFEMALTRGERNYQVHPVRGRLATGGTRVVVGPLLTSTRNIVTGEKLERYLSSELRDRIRNARVKIQIFDRISRKELTVEPKAFAGERLDEIKDVKTGFGTVRIELYLNSSRDRQGVAVCKDGTRVLHEIAELDAFQTPPWTEGRLEGVIDFPALNLAPGDRSGIVPDERMQAFVDAVQSVAPEIAATIAARDQAESDRANRQVLRQVQRAFVGALRAMPRNEYLYFDIPRDGKKAKREGSAAHADERQTSLLSGEPGPLATVSISPGSARRRPGEPCLLRAKPRDEDGNLIKDGVQYQWSIVQGRARIAGANEADCRITKKIAGMVTVAVTVTHGGWEVTEEAVVRFDEQAGEGGAPKTLPKYRLEAGPGEPWRSRYDSTSNEIVVNSAHRDFLASRTPAAKHRRYVGKLYAKEIVAINFPHLSREELLERMVEMLVRTEDAL